MKLHLARPLNIYNGNSRKQILIIKICFRNKCIADYPFVAYNFKVQEVEIDGKCEKNVGSQKHSYYPTFR